MQFSSSSSQCKKLALQPRVHEEQALHLRWEQLEPGVFDALSLQEMVKDCVSKWLQVAMTVAAIAYPPYARVTKVSCTNCTDHSTQAGSKLAELRAGKCIWIHTKTISAAYPHVCWVFPTCLITSFVIGWQSWSTKTLWIKIVIVIVICAEMLQNIVILSEKSPFVVKRSQLFLLKPPALVFWKKRTWFLNASTSCKKNNALAHTLRTSVVAYKWSDSTISPLSNYSPVVNHYLPLFLLPLCRHEFVTDLPEENP